MSHHIVATDNLRHTYPDGTSALSGITFTIHHGESVAVIGANGAGKSTLLMHLNGYLEPTEGTVRVGDVMLTSDTLATVRRTVGMVFQNPDDQLFMPTIAEDVAFGPLNLGLTGEEVEERVADALATVGISHLASKPPYRLSGGEKRRAAIAGVVAMHPDILVMDEPTNGLDPWGRRGLIDLLKGFVHTKIIATHDLDMVMDVCERTIVLKDGAVAADGPTVDIFRDAELLVSCRLEQPRSLAPCPSCGAVRSL